MKNIRLFACLMLLSLGANAQHAIPVSPIAIPPNAHSVKADANGVATSSNAASAQSANAASKASSTSGPSGPPVAKQPPNAVQVPPTART
jgi:hypothetical protein